MRQRLFQILICITLPFYINAQNAEINGVVTYFFNTYQGNKPDIGAKVYLIDSSSNIDFDFEVLTNFRYGSLYRNLHFQYLEIKKVNDNIITTYGKKKMYKQIVETSKIKSEEASKLAAKYYIEMERYQVETKEKFDSLDKKCMFMVYKMDQSKSILKTIDGMGSYSAKLIPGVYYVLIISQNRKDLNMTESTGRIYCEKIQLKDYESKNVSYNFEL